MVMDTYRHGESTHQVLVEVNVALPGELGEDALVKAVSNRLLVARSVTVLDLELQLMQARYEMIGRWLIALLSHNVCQASALSRVHIAVVVGRSASPAITRLTAEQIVALKERDIQLS